MGISLSQYLFAINHYMPDMRCCLCLPGMELQPPNLMQVFSVAIGIHLLSLFYVV